MTADKAKSSRLGRGLSALIGDMDAISDGADDTGVKRGVSELAISDIRPNPAQPRRTFSDAELFELAESIRTKGVLQAILVRPDPKTPGRYQIVAGERRWRASQKAGRDTIPAIVRELDDLEVLEIGIIENVQRQDLNPIEEAEAYGQLMKRFGRTQEGLAESLGKSRAHIANTLRLLKLSDSARELLKAGTVSAGHARAALGADDPDSILERVVAKGLSVRDTEQLVKTLGEGPIETKSSQPGTVDEKDVDTKALEADLARVLGLDVDIRHSGRRGELRIRYRSLEQLDDLCAKLTRKK